MTVGSPGLVAQSVQTAALVTLHPLVSDGARYAVMAAQLSHRKIIAPPVFDKAKALFPHIALFPGHRLPVCPKVFTMCPVHFVQYVPGIYPRHGTHECVRHQWTMRPIRSAKLRLDLISRRDWRAGFRTVGQLRAKR